MNRAGLAEPDGAPRLCAWLAWFCLSAASPGASPGAPPAWAPRLAWESTFDALPPAGNAACSFVRVVGAPPRTCAGFLGTGATGGDFAVRLDLIRVPVERGFTVSFWWALAEPLPLNGGFGLCHLAGRSGYISLFVRGGPWCALKDSAAVFQLWNFDGVSNVNLIWKRNVRKRVDLSPLHWHHTALTITAGRRIQGWLDGHQVFDVRTRGRALGSGDALHRLVIGGGPYGGNGRTPLILDEVMVLSIPPAGRELSEYVTAMRALREAWREPGSD